MKPTDVRGQTFCSIEELDGCLDDILLTFDRWQRHPPPLQNGLADVRLRATLTSRHELASLRSKEPEEIVGSDKARLSDGMGNGLIMLRDRGSE